MDEDIQRQILCWSCFSKDVFHRFIVLPSAGKVGQDFPARGAKLQASARVRRTGYRGTSTAFFFFLPRFLTVIKKILLLPKDVVNGQQLSFDNNMLKRFGERKEYVLLIDRSSSSCQMTSSGTLFLHRCRSCRTTSSRIACPKTNTRRSLRATRPGSKS